MNLLRLKCNFLKIQTKDNADILMIFETKLDDRFPTRPIFNNWLQQVLLAGSNFTNLKESSTFIEVNIAKQILHMLLVASATDLSWATSVSSI